MSLETFFTAHIVAIGPPYLHLNLSNARCFSSGSWTLGKTCQWYHQFASEHLEGESPHLRNVYVYIIKNNIHILNRFPPPSPQKTTNLHKRNSKKKLPKRHISCSKQKTRKPNKTTPTHPWGKKPTKKHKENKPKHPGHLLKSFQEEQQGRW